MTWCNSSLHSTLPRHLTQQLFFRQLYYKPWTPDCRVWLTNDCSASSVKMITKYFRSCYLLRSLLIWSNIEGTCGIMPFDNSDTSLSFWNKRSWLFYWSSRLLLVEFLYFEAQQLKGTCTVVVLNNTTFLFAIAVTCSYLLPLLVNSQFRSICGPKMKWVKAARNSMQMKRSVATFYCCSSAWAFCAGAI